MADGSRSFNFPLPQRSRLRPGEIVVDLFAGVPMICRPCRRDHRRAMLMHAETICADDSPRDRQPPSARAAPCATSWTRSTRWRWRCGVTAHSTEFGVFAYSDASKNAEALGVVNAQPFEALQLLLKNLKIIGMPRVFVWIRISDELAWAWHHTAQDALSHVSHCIVMADKGSQVGPQRVGQIVNPVKNAFGLRHNRPFRILQHLPEEVWIHDDNLPCLDLDRPGNGGTERMESSGQLGNLIQEQPAKNLGIRSLLGQHLMALLLSYAFCILGDFGRPSSRPIRGRRDPDSAGRCAKANYNSSPVGHIPPINRERAYSHRRSLPSMLEPILP